MNFTLIAVDGVDGSGKTTFAGALAEQLQNRGFACVVIHADDFLNLRSVRHRQGKDSPEGFWQDSYDYQALQHWAIDPFRAGGDGRFSSRATDVRQDRYLDVETFQAAPGTVAIIEGMFLHRDELREMWDFSVFLHAPFSVTAVRMAVRDGSSADPEHPSMRRYVEGQRLYFAHCEPSRRASVVVDNTWPELPRLLEPEELLAAV